MSGPFLLFRPFRSLLYYHEEFRDLINHQEKMLQERPARNTETEEDVENETEKKFALADLEQMKCLISFIDSEIKKKQEYLTSCRCQSVPFADVPMLFSPGGAVISKDHKQVYRVIKVSCTRHRVKSRKEKTSLDFLKDESEVELEDNPVFVHCIHLDFDGKVMGPISRLFMIQKYDGEREVTSFPVFPLRYVREDGFHEKLVKRGKMFFKVVGIKHMHYTGLTLKTRDDIDSQVVIDFEEAINRHPHWKPPITSVLEESPGISDKEDQDLRGFLKAQTSMRKVCIRECCATESQHLDEYVEDRRKEDYIVSQMNREFPTRLPVTIVPHDFRDIAENNTLTDDEYLIMSYRVFAFVLRSRKWHELDMTHLFEVATLGAGEGFDELVLPPGHGDMVKSMIRQHLRDRNLSSINREKTDVVRGKGRGLIILLHGVPGVGKTSTAECVADLFRRPLFQITSGDLGTTAKEVEDALEENFSLASRWNSILLIDEADVFLAERTKEDFVRNSLVAVFLRMMEYYAGVLFLTTNRVGVFDEAFTSRIHISLYYPPLDRKSTLQIFQKNWNRINTRYQEAGRIIDIDIPEITEFAIDYFENNKEGRWNGRQIRNAFQSALALAELDALGTDDFLNESEHNRPVALGRKNFDTVAEAYKGFTSYLKQVYGADFARRARENLWRFDAFGAPRMPNNLNTRLKIAEPAVPPPPPPPGQWPGQSHAGYDSRNPQQYYPPQQQYAGSYDHPAQRPAYPPTSRPYTYPDPRERRDDKSDAEGSNPPQQHYAESYDRPGQRPAYPPASRPYLYPESGERRDAGPGAGDFDQ
ncbi:P-loop containing nucleoside triphosphate hydrolase protein [Xylaria acuta]|nr:P-loop containing nucleoside triphosphate hydrolase protein [Xylaria acuta]